MVFHESGGWAQVGVPVEPGQRDSVSNKTKMPKVILRGSMYMCMLTLRHSISRNTEIGLLWAIVTVDGLRYQVSRKVTAPLRAMWLPPEPEPSGDGDCVAYIAFLPWVLVQNPVVILVETQIMSQGARKVGKGVCLNFPVMEHVNRTMSLKSTPGGQ